MCGSLRLWEPLGELRLCGIARLKVNHSVLNLWSTVKVHSAPRSGRPVIPEPAVVCAQGSASKFCVGELLVPGS